MSGASAGSIWCVMAVCNVDMDHARNVAVRLANEAGIFTRRGDPAGAWGKWIKRWLHEILADESHITCCGKVHISVTSLTASLMPMHCHVVNVFFLEARPYRRMPNLCAYPISYWWKILSHLQKRKVLGGILIFFLTEFAMVCIWRVRWKSQCIFFQPLHRLKANATHMEIPSDNSTGTFQRNVLNGSYILAAMDSKTGKGACTDTSSKCMELSRSNQAYSHIISSVSMIRTVFWNGGL